MRDTIQRNLGSGSAERPVDERVSCRQCRRRTERLIGVACRGRRHDQGAVVLGHLPGAPIASMLSMSSAVGVFSRGPTGMVLKPADPGVWRQPETSRPGVGRENAVRPSGCSVW